MNNGSNRNRISNIFWWNWNRGLCNLYSNSNNVFQRLGDEIQMTINHIYNIVIDTMNKLEDIDFINLDKRKYNQQQLNEAYKILDDFKDELIREDIKRRHK